MLIRFVSNGNEKLTKNTKKNKAEVLLAMTFMGGREASLMGALSTSPGLFDPVHVPGEMPICFSSRLWGGVPL